MTASIVIIGGLALLCCLFGSGLNMGAVATNGWPAQDPVMNRLCQLTGGVQGGYGQTREVPTAYYHRLNVPNNGQRQYTFFNESRAKGITNLDQPSTIPANTAFALKAMRFNFLYGIDRLGSRATVFVGGGAIGQTGLSGGGAGAVATDTLVDDQWKAQEVIRELLEQGAVTFQINNRPVFENYGLVYHPSGTGVAGFGTSDTGATLTAQAQVSHFSAQISNGIPMLANAFTFPTPFPMPAGCTFSVIVDYQALVDFQQATIGPLVGATAGAPAGTLQCVLEGLSVTPGSN